MPTVDYKPLANDPAANVVAQAVYLVLLGVGGALEHGFQDGVARSEYMNKVLRQVTVMSAAMAGVISDALAVDVLDDGDVNSLKAKLAAALLTSAWSTGDGKITMKVVADTGWVMMNDGTIGSGASGASTRANDDTLALFTLLWTNVGDTFAPVVGGRGGSAALDWAVNKKITLTRQLGRAIGIAGAGAGLTARALGEYLGEENHVLTDAELPADAWVGIGGGPATFDTSPQNAHSWGGGQGHNTMQPTTFWNVMIKL